MNKDTSWQKVATWYNKITKNGGHYYHQHVVTPKLMKLLNIDSFAQILDIGCGNGYFAKEIDKNIQYVGIDASSTLIEEAKINDKNDKHKYIVVDATKHYDLKQKFSHVVFVLSLQNMNDPKAAIESASSHLANNGTLVIVLNHPAFRIPRQSSWDIDEATKIQSRKISRYMSPMEIPIKAHPGAKQSPVTWSYHYPISYYSEILYQSGLLIEKIEEWTSDKQSVGKSAKSENRARDEFPLFMAIKARNTKI